MNENIPVKTINLSGFFEIPGYSKYGITLDGKVFNKQKNKFLTGSVNPAGYTNIRITDDDGIVLTWGLHRLLAYVFLNPGVDINDLFVNHIDGDKTNNKLYNLEWVTPKGNVEHAGSIGITSKCMPVSVRDVITGDIKEFPSIVECARFYGYTKDTVNWRVKAGERKVFPDGRQYRLGTSSKIWHKPNVLEINKLGNASKQVLMRDVFTGKVTVFDQITALSKSISVPMPTLSLWLSSVNQPVLPGFIQLKWVSDPLPWRKVQDPYLELAQYTGKTPVQTMHELSNKIDTFTSAVDCAKARNISTTMLNYRLKSKGKVVFSDGYRYSKYPLQITNSPF